MAQNAFPNEHDELPVGVTVDQKLGNCQPTEELPIRVAFG